LRGNAQELGYTMRGKTADAGKPNRQTALISTLIGGFSHPNLQVYGGQPRFDLGRKTHGNPLPYSLILYV